MLWNVVRSSIDAQIDSSTKSQFQPCRRNKNIRVELVSGFKLDGVRRDVLDVSGLDTTSTFSKTLVKIAVWTHAHPLLERIVRRTEVGI